jgi:uncharacterized protein (DUF427 family)
VQPERVEPGPGQESVWDYPRPPALDRSDHHVVVRFGGEVIADTRRPMRVLETSQPPAYYLPAADVRTDLLRPDGRRTFCEWKGQASYSTVDAGLVDPNEGSFYGGWITSKVVGPFKGAPGTIHW